MELTDFFAEVNETLEEKEMTQRDMSMEAFGSFDRYGHVKKTRNPGVQTLDRIARAIGMKLVVCLVEGEGDD